MPRVFNVPTVEVNLIPLTTALIESLEQEHGESINTTLRQSIDEYADLGNLCFILEGHVHLYDPELKRRPQDPAARLEWFIGISRRSFLRPVRFAVTDYREVLYWGVDRYTGRDDIGTGDDLRSAEYKLSFVADLEDTCEISAFADSGDAILESSSVESSATSWGPLVAATTEENVDQTRIVTNVTTETFSQLQTRTATAIVEGHSEDLSDPCEGVSLEQVIDLDPVVSSVDSTEFRTVPNPDYIPDPVDSITPSVSIATTSFGSSSSSSSASAWSPSTAASSSATISQSRVITTTTTVTGRQETTTTSYTVRVNGLADTPPPSLPATTTSVATLPASSSSSSRRVFRSIANPAYIAPPVVILGCTDSAATNFNSAATADDGSCVFAPSPILGCTDSAATNYDASATADDGSCVFAPVAPTGRVSISATGAMCAGAFGTGISTALSSTSGNWAQVFSIPAVGDITPAFLRNRVGGCFLPGVTNQIFVPTDAAGVVIGGTGINVQSVGGALGFPGTAPTGVSVATFAL